MPLAPHRNRRRRCGGCAGYPSCRWRWRQPITGIAGAGTQPSTMTSDSCRSRALNRRKKFAVVASAMVANDSPRRSAMCSAHADQRWMIQLAAKWHRRQIRRVGFHQHLAQRHLLRHFLDLGGVLEGDDAGERNIKPSSSAAYATSQVSVKQCITPPIPARFPRA